MGLFSLRSMIARLGSFAIVLILGLMCAVSVRNGLLSSSGATALAAGPSATPTPVADVCPMNGQPLGPGNAGTDLIVIGGVCTVNPGMHMQRNINILNGGTLMFTDGKTDLQAANIIIENGGAMIAGSVTSPIVGPLTIHLYGDNLGPGGAGALCLSNARCGVPNDTWISNSTMNMYPKTCEKNPDPKPPGGVDDCFYSYDALPFDNGKPTFNNRFNQPFGYYGYKVIGVGYGGTLQLYGKKGATYDTTVDATNTGTSWVRLNNCATGSMDSFCKEGVLQPGASTIVLSKPVDWQMNDNIVIASTDYMPGHAEQVMIKSVTNSTTFVVTPSLRFPHNASVYSLSNHSPNKVPVANTPTGWTSIDTRASVALLTRSIRIVSEGKTVGSDFPAAPPPATPATTGYYFGGHMVIRQGIKKLQIQGVEFYQMGQGGEIGHYPVHFHMTRQVPADTFLKDNSVWDSMTRWYVLHATQGVLMARNVGYASIGHGYYLEDGTETNNKLYANIGIFARAAVSNAQNPRNVPGILAAPDYPIINRPPKDGGPLQTGPSDDVVPYHSDWDHPSVFWIMNAWNDFENNMAAGAGTCGVCYWMLPGINSGMSRNMHWTSYASEQQLPDAKTQGGTTPLQIFTGNSCVSAMASFLTIANATACNGVQIGSNQNNSTFPVLQPAALPSPAVPLAPSSKSGTMQDKNGLSADNYYPHIGGGGRFPTKCPASGDCSTQPVCGDEDQSNCVITNIDHYTTSFNWAETNFAAIWLRPQWYLFINSALTDIQNGGITFVTGGGYTHADVINGHWALARKSVFVGNTQSSAASGGFASNAGPFNPDTMLKCEEAPNGAKPGNYCLDSKDGVSFAIGNFANNQRLFSIYDGPAYQDSTAYLDTTRTSLPNDPIKGCDPQGSMDPSPDHNCANSQYSQAGKELGMPYDANKMACYLPNAAIAWKQPNGFFYPPAFHSRNLFFDNVDIRHFVIEPLFDPTKGLFVTDGAASRKRYCTYAGGGAQGVGGMFTGFTDIDRQTELNDDDATLTGLLGPTATTGLTGSISVNQDPFFQAPVQAPECLSDVDVTPAQAKNPDFPGTAVTSPYDYVSTVVFPQCAANGGECNKGDSIVKRQPNNTDGPSWDQDCANQTCYGVPLYRENLLGTETKPIPIRLMGQSKFQRSSLTTNNNRYYIDTTPSLKAQDTPSGNFPIFHINAFLPGQTYYVFLLFAKKTTKQTYDLYVGPNFDVTDQNQLWLTRVALPSTYNFTKAGPIPEPKDKMQPRNVSYNSSTGVLSVTLDMSLISDFNADKILAAQESKCQPKTFCRWIEKPAMGEDNCQCAASIFSPPTAGFQSAECSTKNGICSWATKDLDCPEGGCVGFGVKLSKDFVASDSPPNPAPIAQTFPSGPMSPWNAPFTSPVPATDACMYSNPQTLSEDDLIGE
jgi:G8 domain